MTAPKMAPGALKSVKVTADEFEMIWRRRNGGLAYDAALLAARLEALTEGRRHALFREINRRLAVMLAKDRLREAEAWRRAAMLKKGIDEAEADAEGLAIRRELKKPKVTRSALPTNRGGSKWKPMSRIGKL